MKYILIIISILININVIGQSYTSYFTGSSVDKTTNPEGGICLMGGGSEHDEAMKWFLQRANGGDILVLRASGSNGYNSYLYSQLGVVVNSVESIVFNNATASDDNYIHQKIQQAEAIWFAGGDQWNYVSYWRNTPIDSLINDAIQKRNIVIGGTSAGMAILGGYYFSAQKGTVTSTQALANPYDYRVTVDSTTFIENKYIEDVVTDTHYDDRERKGRHVVFLARILSDYGTAGKGIACNGNTAVCIDQNGLARVFGDDHASDEIAYFIQTNCELSDVSPENCTASNPLDWDLNGSALKVYKVNGTDNGLNSFNLADWVSGEGGSWEDWYVDNGTLLEQKGKPIKCSALSIIDKGQKKNIKIFPNPTKDMLSIIFDEEIQNIEIADIKGAILFNKKNINNNEISLNFSQWSSGIYYLRLGSHNKDYFEKIVIN